MPYSSCSLSKWPSASYYLLNKWANIVIPRHHPFFPKPMISRSTDETQNPGSNKDSVAATATTRVERTGTRRERNSNNGTKWRSNTTARQTNISEPASAVPDTQQLENANLNFFKINQRECKCRSMHVNQSRGYLHVRPISFGRKLSLFPYMCTYPQWWVPWHERAHWCCHVGSLQHGANTFLRNFSS